MSHPPSQERWSQIERRYHAARELPSDERAAWLKAVCRNDVELHSAVEKLLAADAEANDFLQRPALQLQADKLAAEATPSLFSQPSALAERLNHYRVLARIGAGGMGEVYLALDEKLERKIALKILPVQFVQEAARLQRFEREAKAASALNHPNIITIYEIGAVGDTHFIATEYIEGVTLRERLKRGQLDVREALAVTAQVAAALEAAHKSGIIHRDIKPENIMLRPDGLVKVLDFGLARFAEVQRTDSHDVLAEADTLPAITPARAGGVSMTDAGTIMGTPRYMSPEQARGLKVDARTDIFSLGEILYEMITGERAFPGESVADIFLHLLHEEPTRLVQGLPDAPAALTALLRRALAKDRDQRLQTVSEFSAALATLKHQGESATELAQTRPLAQPAPTTGDHPAAQTAATAAAATQSVTLTPRTFAFGAALVIRAALGLS